MISAAEKEEVQVDRVPFFVQATEVYTQRISPKTEFLFVRVLTSNGVDGWGEGTFNSLNAQVLPALQILAQAIETKDAIDALKFLSAQPCWKNGRAFRIAKNALEQAILDAEARVRQVPLFKLLGKQRRKTVPCYANINRGTKDRSTEGWAQRATAAISAGFNALKLAPFDGVSETGASKDRLTAASAGIDATKAVRAEIGNDPGLLLDCHWRFDLKSACGLIEQLRDASLFWIEAPILEDYGNIPDLRAIREVANSSGILLAGGEFHTGARAFAPFLDQSVYNTINPDIRFCGIPDMVMVADTAASKDVQFSPHNHLGPVMTAASLHVMAIAPTAQMLELQYAESDETTCIASPEQLMPVDGAMKVPTGHGLGIEIDTRALSRVQLD